MENEKFEYKSKGFVNELRRIGSIDKFETGDRDLNAYFQAKKRRAKKLGLEVEESYGNVEVYEASTDRAKSYRDISYNITHETIRLRHDVTIKKNGRKLFSHSSFDGNAKIDVVDLIDRSFLPKDDYSCPNCGNFASAEILGTQGCPYCGTHFELPQLFPKVTAYTYRERSVDLNKTAGATSKKVALTAAGIGFGIEVLISIAFMIDHWPNLMVLIPYWIVALFILFFVVIIPYAISYNFLSTRNQFRHNIHGIKNNKIERANEKSNENFENDMRAFSPNFNFQYFASKVYSLLGSLIFAESAQEAPSYRGPDPKNYFANIVDYLPIGIKLISFAAESKKFASIVLSVFADTYIYTGDKIEHKKTQFTFRVTKNLSYPMKLLFSPRTYNCSGCSATYDVTKTPTCPYCGRPHEVLDFDWFIDGPVEGKFVEMNLIDIHDKV